MTHDHTSASLIAFEDRVAAAFEAKQVRGPIHLCSDSQAEPLLDIFRDIQPEDWVLSTWRAHWHCLLKGVPEDEVFAACLAGRSMMLNFAAQRVICSAIVGGIVPIAVGLAMGIKRQERVDWDAHDKTYRGRVWVFCGDMCSTTGLYHEAVRYTIGHNLPVRFVVENNGLSTNAKTFDTWGLEWTKEPPVQSYIYQRSRPHTGTGRHVTF